MRTRRDQVQAYRFVTRRIVSAMVSGEPESSELPMRRAGIGIVASLMVAALVLAGFGVYGQVTKSGGKLDNNDLVIEKGSGATYVYVNGKLHPALNYATARLFFGADVPEVKQMSEKALRGKPRGRPIGIADAPDSLPDAKALTTGPWQVCSTQPANGKGVSHLVIGTELPGGRRLDTRSLLVRTDSERFLVTGNRAMRIPDDTAMTALDLTGKQMIQVSVQLVNVLVAGPTLSPPEVPYLGTKFKEPVDGRPAEVGDLFKSSSSHYVLTKDGLVAVGEVTARLMTAAGSTEREIGATAASALLGGEPIQDPSFPQAVPVIDESVSSQGAVCASYHPLAGSAGSDAGQIVVTAHARLAEELRPPGEEDIQSRPGTNAVSLVDKVVLAGGSGVLAVAELSDGRPTPGGTVYLITDNLKKYALGSADAQNSLGYGGVTPVAVPGSMLAVIPDGAYLDQKVAEKYIDATG